MKEEEGEMGKWGNGEGKRKYLLPFPSLPISLQKSGAGKRA